jgi:hypothetical protein
MSIDGRESPLQHAVHHIPSRLRALAVPGAAVVAALALSGPAAAAPAPSSYPASPTVSPAPLPGTQGIIMRDGGICDPIRWGC